MRSMKGSVLYFVNSYPPRTDPPAPARRVFDLNTLDAARNCPERQRQLLRKGRPPDGNSFSLSTSHAIGRPIQGVCKAKNRLFFGKFRSQNRDANVHRRVTRMLQFVG